MRERKHVPEGIQASLSKALDNHFVACAAVATAAVVGGYAEHAQAAIVYSGLQNVSLGAGGANQLYINLVTNTSAHTPGGATGWDLNPYLGTNASANFLIYTPAKLQLVRSPSNNGADTARLTGGASISSSSTFVPYFDGFETNSSGLGDWSGTGSGYLGVKITETGVNGGNPMYGWVQISKSTNSALPITFVDWAYDNSGASIAAGDTGVPEPTSLGLLAFGAVGVFMRRNNAKRRQMESSVA